MNELLKEIKEYFNSTPKEDLDKMWESVLHLNQIGPDVEEYYNSADMTQEVENWIRGNNPYKLVRGIGGQWDVLNAQHRGWEEGATAMAEHLQNQPLTNKQLDKVFALYDQMMLESLDKDKPLSFQERNNYIIKHWSND